MYNPLYSIFFEYLLMIASRFYSLTLLMIKSKTYVVVRLEYCSYNESTT